MSEQHDNLIEIAHGAEKSRKAGWACYNREKELKKAAINDRNRAEDETARLAVTIAYNETLQIIEPDGELVMMARQTIARLRLTASGQRALRKILEERRNEREAHQQQTA